MEQPAEDERPVNIIMRKVDAICAGRGFCVDTHISVIEALGTQHSPRDVISALAGRLWDAHVKRRHCERAWASLGGKPCVPEDTGECAFRGGRRAFPGEPCKRVKCNRCEQVVSVLADATFQAEGPEMARCTDREDLEPVDRR